MITTSTVAKVLLSLTLTAHPVLSLGINLAQFSGGTCEDDTFISPIIYYTAATGDCFTWDTAVGKSFSVDTTTGHFVCADNQYAVLQVWQSSKNCDNLADASVGALATMPTEGGCIIAPVRSARLKCQNNDGT
ncbi:hypothetical protein IAQ61_000535 [Plenodomus lingam]|uniref:uncharacterized protein n=1 Tax=Leptosphaeria maculans TaxID=5022 RepID=UPI003325DB9C|nr:hypothetical protein IAQ61_000535 [Plenodomus lingam]